MDDYIRGKLPPMKTLSLSGGNPLAGMACLMLTSHRYERAYACLAKHIKDK